MSSQAAKLKIGLFVVVSLSLAVSALVWLGVGRYLEKSQIVVAYFSESVQGLESDSPVKFRGVPVGRVKAIRMAPDGRLIEVEMNLDRNFKRPPDLGVKMNLLGLTGLKYLEMDTFRPDQAREEPPLTFKPSYPVINTYSSDIKEIGNALENIFQKVKALDLEKMSNNMTKVSARLDKILSDPKFDSIGSDAADAVKEFKDVGRKINEEVTRIQRAKSVAKTLDKAAEVLTESTETVRNVDRLVRRTDNNINQLTQKLNRGADNLIDITQTLKTNPWRIFWGSEEKPQKKR